jgi:hypothetical protein
MEAITWAGSLCGLYLSVDRIADVVRAKQGTQIVGYSVITFFFPLPLFPCFFSFSSFPFLSCIIVFLCCDKLWRNWTLHRELWWFLLVTILRSQYVDCVDLTLFCVVQSLPRFIFPFLRGNVVGCGTTLQAGRSRVPVQMRWNFFNWPNPSSLTMNPGVDPASNRTEYQESSWG